MKNVLLLILLLLSVFKINCFAQQPGWEIIPSGTTEELNSIYFYDYETGYACGSAGVVIKSVDSGKTWQTFQSPISQNLNDLLVADKDCFFGVGDSCTILMTINSGDTWHFENNILGFTENLYALSFPGEGSWYAGAIVGSSQTTITGGSTACSISLFDSIRGSHGVFWDVCMLTQEIGFVVGEDSTSQPIFGKTFDFGINWELIPLYFNGNQGKATGVDFNFNDHSTGYVSTGFWNGQGAIAKTIDSGNNWTTTFFNNPLWGIDFPKSGASQVGYCVGDAGTILKTYNAGENWQPQQSGTSEKLNKVHFLDLDFGFAVGENGTILRTTTGGETTTQTEGKEKSLYSFELQQNYPNPFNPSTKIKYKISRTGFTSLKVHDVLGNEVATLVYEENPAGSYEVEFDASSLPSGIYFYQLQTPNFTQTKKMILLK